MNIDLWNRKTVNLPTPTLLFSHIKEQASKKDNSVPNKLKEVAQHLLNFSCLKCGAYFEGGVYLPIINSDFLSLRVC